MRMKPIASALNCERHWRPLMPTYSPHRGCMPRAICTRGSGCKNGPAFVVLSLIVVVAGFNIISILTMAVNERRREIGHLKSNGCSTQKHRPNFFSRRSDNRRERRIIRQHTGRGPVPGYKRSMHPYRFPATFILSTPSP